MRKLTFLSVLLSFLVIGCENVKLSPIAPSDSGPFPTNDNDIVRDAVSKWSPYVGVHPTGEAFDAYRDSLSIMRQAGKLKGVRVGIAEVDHLNNPIIRMFGSLGIEMLGLIDNHYLFDQNIEKRIDEIFAAYPEIRYFQIGNEITSILPPSGPTITTEGYMVVLKKIYNHVQRNHQGRAVLLTYSVLGSGLRGPTELEKMTQLGLTEMSPDKIIITINSYGSENMGQYFGVLNGPLRRYRVWITETGIADPNLQISYVAQNYQKFRDYLRAERIYWYVMWGGDGPPDMDFSLIRYPGNYPNYWKSPLFKALTEKQ